jgi:hypothetical protein
LALGSSLTSQPAHSAESSFFLNAGVGRSSINAGPLDSDTGYSVDGGYRWGLGSTTSLGVDAGYADLGTFSTGSSLAGVNFDVHGPTLGTTFHWNISPDWYASGRAGYMSANFRASTNYGFSQHETVGGWYAGLGYGYNFGEHASLGLAYDYYRFRERGVSTSPNLISVNAEYRF